MGEGKERWIEETLIVKLKPLALADLEILRVSEIYGRRLTVSLRSLELDETIRSNYSWRVETLGRLKHSRAN